MASELNFFDTYVLMAITEEIVPQQTFFRDRYFPTGERDIFACDKVLTEYRKGDRKMAAFVSARAGDIPMDRIGYAIHEYQPAFHRAVPSADAGRPDASAASARRSTPTAPLPSARRVCSWTI